MSRLSRSTAGPLAEARVSSDGQYARIDHCFCKSGLDHTEETTRSATCDLRQ